MRNKTTHTFNFVCTSMKALLTTAFILVATTFSFAQLGDGWKTYSPVKRIHLDNVEGLQTFTWTSYKSVCEPEICADYRYESSDNSETFRIFDTRSNRSEIRLQNDYSTGSRQFEGYVTIYPPLNDESLMQIFGSTSGATQMMLRGYAADGGSMRGAGKTVATNIYGTEVKVNVIHLQEDVGNKIQIYINDVKMAEIADNEAVTNYHKYGNYGTMRTGEAVVKWRNCRFFRDGSEPGATITTAITAPATGASFDAPANITINATADDTIHGVVKVEFFNGSVKLGEDVSSPYSFVWNGVMPGTFTLQSRATNGAGLVVSSAPVTVTVKGSSMSFDVTDNGGTITAQYANTSKPQESFPSLIDNTSSTKYYISNRTNLWVQYRSAAPAIVVRYTITSANDVPTRDPKNWMLQGSNNGSSWTTLDTRSNEVFESRFMKKSFAFENTTPYLYYRLQITANSGHAGTQFSEWELFERRAQTITFEGLEEKTFGDEPFQVVAHASSGLPVSIELVSGPATVGGDTIAITGAGVITLRASQVGNEFYFPAPDAETSIIVNKAPQTIEFDSIATKTYGDAPFELNAEADTGLPVIFEVISGPATIDGSILTITGAGEITVSASQAGNENYLAAYVEQTFAVEKAGQTITFDPISPVHQSDLVDLIASSTSGLPVTFEVISGHGALGDNTLAFTGEGEVVVEAIQAGNENYHAATPVQQMVLVYADDTKDDAIKMIVHPNPTKGKLKVKLDNKKDKDYTFIVYDRFGNPVATAVIPRSHKMFDVDFDMTESGEGLYYLWVSDGTDITVRRIIKE